MKIDDWSSSITGNYWINQMRSEILSSWVDPLGCEHHPFVLFLLVEIQNYPDLYLNTTAEYGTRGQVCKLHGFVIKIYIFPSIFGQL